MILHSSSRSKGFSLIEILIGVALIAIMIILQNAVLKSTTIAQGARNKDIALKIAQHKLEDLRALGHDGLPVSGSFTDALLSKLPNGAGAMVISDYATNLKAVKVTVTWTDKIGDRSLELDTLVGKVGGL